MYVIHICPVCDEEIPFSGYHAHHEDEEWCDYCGGLIDEENPGEPCSGADGPVHSWCHNESGCRRAE